MLQTRAKLQQALNSLLAAKSQKDRAAAGDRLVTIVRAHVASTVTAVEEPFPVERVLRRTLQELGDIEAPVSRLTDDELETFNRLLPWGAMTLDQAGREVGQVWSADKRGVPSGLIDPRQTQFDKVFPLKGRTVMEIGCFEGIHTLGLLLLGAEVTAVDGRVENVMKTMSRLWAYGRACELLLWNVERPAPETLPKAWDVLHHIGVLYHLSNPVEHLNELLPRTGAGLLLDTHVMSDEAETSESYAVGGQTFRTRRKPEVYADSSPFAGMEDHAKYLVLDDLVRLIASHGFGDLRIVSDRDERNGRRVTIWAFR